MSNSLSAFCFRECPVRGLIIVFSESHVAWRSPSCGNGSWLHCFSLVILGSVLSVRVCLLLLMVLLVRLNIFYCTIS